MDPISKLLIIAAGLIVFSVIASKAGSRFGIPALVVFLLLGIGAGSHGLELVSFSDVSIAQELGVVALILILFSGGMDTEIETARDVIAPSVILSTLGVLVGSVLVGVFARKLLGFTLAEGMLLGAAVSATDVAAVFTVLRSRNLNLKSGLRPLLELESALNDPMTVFLSVGLLDVIQTPSHSILTLIPSFLIQTVVGLGLGWASGNAIVFMINRIRLEFEGLYPVFTVGWVFLTYAVVQILHGSGFLAVYVAGVVLGSHTIIQKRSLLHFHDGIAWLMQIAMFLTMGLLIDPHELWAIAPYGLAVSVFLVLIARPASVFFCLWKRFTPRENWMISWAGLRGAVPIILATYPLIANIPRAREIFNLVFFVVITSVLFQGATIPAMADWLKVSVPFRGRFRFPIEFNPAIQLKNRLEEITISPTSNSLGKSLIDLQLPKNTLIVLIRRRDEILVPRGSTRLEAGDELLVLTEQALVEKTRNLLA